MHQHPSTSTRPPAGLYIHVPFCEKRCPYCDFAVSVKVDVPHQTYTDAVVDELRSRSHQLADHRLATIYFGGGTPSLLAPECLGRLVEEAHRLFDVVDDPEVTLESNPNEVTADNLIAWRTLGITRLSIGCQSFQNRHLEALRRNHDGALARCAAERALEVMDRVSIDLMFAGPSQPMEEWSADLEVMQRLVVDCGLDHVSGYNLTIEPDTAFWIRRKRGTVEVPDHDTAASMLERLVEATAEVGLDRYEVSNFSVPGGESRHNSSYWRGRPYLGVGVGAHSLRVLDGGRAVRRANPRRYADYLDADGEPDQREELEPVEHLAERLFLGARTTFGIDVHELTDLFGGGVSTERMEGVHRRLVDLAERGWMRRAQPEHFLPTARGLNFSDALAEWLYEAAVECE